MFLRLLTLSVSLYTGAPSEPTTQLKLGSESAGSVQKSDSGIPVQVYSLPVSFVPEDGQTHYGAIVSVYEPQEGLFWWAWYCQSINPSIDYAIKSFLRESRIWSDSERLAVFRHGEILLYAKVSHERYADRKEGLRAAIRKIKKNRDVLISRSILLSQFHGEFPPPRFPQGIKAFYLIRILVPDFFKKSHPLARDRIVFLQKVEWRGDRFVVTYRGNQGRLAELHLDERLRVLDVVYLEKEP